MNATNKQTALISRLTAERGLPMPNLEGVTVQGASALIEELFATPRAAAAAAAALEVGMYRTADGSIYRVQASRETGNLYAKRLVVGVGFEYAPGAIRSLTAADRMTLEEAQAFGVETGICCVCAALLTDPKSVSRGIGPVCAKRV